MLLTNGRQMVAKSLLPLSCICWFVKEGWEGKKKWKGKEKKRKKIKRKKERANFPQQQPASILIHESPSCRNLLF